MQSEAIRRWGQAALAALTVIVLIGLQPDLPVTSLRWVFPILSMSLVAITWLIISPNSEISWAVLLLIALCLFIGTMLVAKVTTTRGFAIAGLGLGVGISFWRLFAVEADRKKIALTWMLIIAGGLLLFKTPFAAEFLARIIRINAGIDASFAAPNDLEWLGVSYVSLRLIAVLIDFRADRLPLLTFWELLIYTLFPLTLLAGPIDRLQRFLPDLRAGVSFGSEAMISGGGRVVAGLFKKFVLADTLALVALSPQIAADTRGMVGAWLVVYIYAFQIYLDFSGYTDIVIGLGRMIGFDLPENFNAPYLKPNLNLFWQNWHMTLTNWFRSNIFLPLSRHLLRADAAIPPYLVAQMATMLLIGMWHGVTVNFALWAMWHAVGLTAQRWFSFAARRHVLRLRQNAVLGRLLDAAGVLLTFHYVAVGWVFFALPEAGMSFDHLRRMFSL